MVMRNLRESRRRRRGRSSRIVLLRTLLALEALTLILPGVSRGDEAGPTEYEVKAAYLYNFARFVEWPSDAFVAPTSPFVVAVLGEDPFGSALEDLLTNKKILNRDITIVRTRNPEEAAHAHLVFIASSELHEMPHILRALAGRSILSVGDVPDMARQGSVIGFRMEAAKVRFDINTASAQQARLKLRSQLLKVARIIG